MKFEKEKKPEEMANKVLKEDLKIPILKAGQSGLNLGAGDLKFAGWLNHDKEMWDLNNFPYPWKEHTFDYVILHHVIEHLEPENQKKAVRECSRILKQGGKLIMHYPHYSGPTAKLSGHYTQLSRNSFGIELGFSTREITLLPSQYRRRPITKWFINRLGNYYEKLNICYVPFLGCFEVQVVFVK